MLEKTHKFFLALVWLSSYFAEILLANLFTLVDEDCTPQVLDKGISEEFASQSRIIFLENVLK